MFRHGTALAYQPACLPARPPACVSACLARRQKREERIERVRARQTTHLNKVAVHFVTVEVSVVRVAVGVVHAQRLLLDERQHARLVRHNGRFVQRGLSVHEHHVAVDEVAVDLVPGLDLKKFGFGHALLQWQLCQRNELAVGLLNVVGA